VRADADERDDDDRAALDESLRVSIEQMNNGGRHGERLRRAR
jgi:hypothetical protein